MRSGDHRCEAGRHALYTTIDGGTALVGLRCMLMRTMFTTWLKDLGDVSVAIYQAKIEELVYVHPPRGACPPV